MTKCVNSFLVILLSVPGFSLDADRACRVKQDVMQAYAGHVNNAGCLISKIEQGKTKYLLLLDRQRGDVNGWGLPGGTHSSKDKDPKIVQDQISYPYIEPAPCTAGRETFEELGVEVVVEDHVYSDKYFTVFQCRMIDPAVGAKIYETPNLTKAFERRLAKDETKELGWFSLDQITAKGFNIRFQNNIAIIKKYEASLKR